MANTFKVKTNANMPGTAGTPLTLYTCPESLYYNYRSWFTIM